MHKNIKFTSILLNVLVALFLLMSMNVCLAEGYPLRVSATFEDGRPSPEIENSLISTVTKLGYPVKDDSFITLKALLSVGNVRTVQGISPKSIVNLNLTIKIMDSELGDTFESLSISGQGLGDSAEDAINKGIKTIKIDQRKLSRMLENCEDDYISIKERRIRLSKERFEEGEKLYRAERYREAIAMLKGVYPETEEYKKAQQLIRDIKLVMPKIAVAILKFKGNSDNISTKLLNVLTDDFVNLQSDDVVVIEREQISQVLDESNLALEGLIDPSTVGEFGMLLGADFILIGNLTASADKVDISAKLVKVATAEIALSSSKSIAISQLGMFSKDLVASFQKALDSGKLDEKPEILSPIEERAKKIIMGRNERVMIVIPETHIHRPVPDPAGETEMIRRFVRMGFKVVDQTQVKRIRDTREAKSAAKGDIQSAVAIARQYGAQIIIVGEAFSENIPRRAAERQTCSARVEARAVYVDTGEILGASGKEANAMDATELIASKKALRRAGGLVADDLIKQIVKGWESQAEPIRNIELFIRRVEFDYLSEIQSFLEDLPNISDVRLRNFDDGVAIIDITSKDSARGIADILSKSELSLKIETVSGNTIEASILTK